MLGMLVWVARLVQVVDCRALAQEPNSQNLNSKSPHTPAAEPIQRAAPSQEEQKGDGAAAAGIEPLEDQRENGGRPLGQQAVREVTAAPPVYYVRDKDGRLVPLLGFSYEEFLKFFEQERETKPTAAAEPFHLNQMTISGGVKGDRAELDAVFNIQTDTTDWVQIELVGGGAILSEPEKYDGSGEHTLSFDPTSDTYQLRLRGAARSEHKVALKLVVPVNTTGPQHRLELRLPTAAASKMSVAVPEKSLSLVSHSGAVSVDIKSTGKESEIELLGLGGPLALVWKSNTAATTSSRPSLQATGEILARIDGRSVQFDATLSVRSLGDEFDRFRVKLPPGAQWIEPQSTPTGYVLTPSGDEKQQIIDVRLAQRSAGPVEIKLHCERAYDVTKADEELELAGFEILEGVPHRQWGHIAVAVVGDWQVNWELRDRVQQIDDLPDDLKNKDVVAGFEYFGQPAKLNVLVTRRKTRINVDPEYVYSIEADRVRLEARLKYSIGGAKAFSLDVGLPGWEIDELGPPEIVDDEAVIGTTSESLRLPLVQAVSGDVEVVLKAHRNLDISVGKLEISLPTLSADVQGPAVVAVVPDNNISVRPIESETSGLRRETTIIGMRLPSRQQPPLVYRADQSQAKFVAEVQKLPQVLQAAVANTIDVDRSEVRIEQTIRYHVEHEPLAALSLDVPMELLRSGAKWEINCDGQPLPLPIFNPSPNAAVAKLQIPLNAPHIGDFEVRIVDHQRAVVVSAANGAEETEPLVMPADAAVVANTVEFQAAPGFKAQALDGSWIEKELPSADPENENGQRQLSADGPKSHIVLAITAESRPGVATIVDRAWVQSWISGSRRQDRAVYHVESANDRLEFSLPAEVSRQKIDAQLDGEPANIESPASGKYVVRFLRGGERPHVLDLRYEIAPSSISSIAGQMPHFPDDVWVERTYWQVVLPGDRNLLSEAGELTSEFAWSWSGVFLSRRDRLNQPELETWTGAAHSAPLPDGTHQYLFSFIGAPGSFLISTVERGQIVFLASLAALTVGLLLIYLPIARRPMVLLMAGGILLILAAWNVDAAILLAQASVLGLVLALVAGCLERIVKRRELRRAVVRSGGSSIIRHSENPQPVRLSEPVSVTSTASIPVAQAGAPSSEAN